MSYNPLWHEKQARLGQEPTADEGLKNWMPEDKKQACERPFINLGIKLGNLKGVDEDLYNKFIVTGGSNIHWTPVPILQIATFLLSKPIDFIFFILPKYLKLLLNNEKVLIGLTSNQLHLITEPSYLSA